MSQVLAKKVFTLYSLAVQQLSKQDHYDFGLRALTSLLRYAGKKRRACPDVADEEVTYAYTCTHTHTKKSLLFTRKKKKTQQTNNRLKHALTVL